MSFETSYLLTYRSVFTDKRILAERWGIPVISVQWVYESLAEKNIRAFQVRKYEGCTFSTSGITNQIFVNYYRLLGAHYTAELNRCADFLVVNHALTEGDKLAYAQEHGIPVISSETVFQDRIELLQKPVEYRTFVQELRREEMFNGVTFYFVGSSDIHQLVRKVIIEHGGTRVEEAGSDITYTVYFGGRARGKQLIWYQWILDSAELETRLAPDAYLVREQPPAARPLEQCTVYLMVCPEEQLKSRNKVLALGGSVSLCVTSKTTHCILDSRKDVGLLKKQLHLEQCHVRMCSAEWLNHCIYQMQKIKEQRFELDPEIKPVLQLQPVRSDARKKTVLRHLPCGLEKWVVQFTGLVEDLKQEAVMILVSKGAAVIDSPEYSRECTHLIVGTVNLSIKFLSAVAAGKELLDYQLIDDIKRNQFRDGKRYSLKSRDFKLDVGKSQAQLIKHMIAAAEKWKRHVARTGQLAFSQWKVLVLPTDKKPEIEALIANGGGEVLECPQENADMSGVPADVLVFASKHAVVPPALQHLRRLQMADIFRHLGCLATETPSSPDRAPGPAAK